MTRRYLALSLTLIAGFLLASAGSPPAFAQARGAAFRDCSACPEMVVVPAGSFMMGTPRDEAGRADNGPYVRGASWTAAPHRLRIGARGQLGTGVERDATIGFLVARDL